MISDIAVESLLLHIRSQNAGVLIHQTEDGVSFASFELSPNPEAVGSCKGRLQRQFPGPVIRIDAELLADDTFRKQIVAFLTQMDREAVMFPDDQGANEATAKNMSTAHPGFITHMLTGILRALGNPVEAMYIQKNTRDEMLCKTNRTPWKRSPLWLLLRVALQLNIQAHCRHADAQRIYKQFMIFFMARLLEGTLSNQVYRGDLSQMSAKIIRRLIKLGDQPRASWLDFVGDVLRKTHKAGTEIWSYLQCKNQKAEQAWSDLDRVPCDKTFDSQMTLGTLSRYLKETSGCNAQPKDLSENLFSHPRISVEIDSLPSTECHDARSVEFWLADVELWVENHLQSWLAVNVGRERSSTAIAHLTTRYIQDATATYQTRPEEFSLMVLTALELWWAIDRIATESHPLLREYSPEIPIVTVKALLLPCQSQMRRIAFIEDYIQRRRSQAKSENPSILKDPKGIAVRCFDQHSLHYHPLLTEIEQGAKGRREYKAVELEDKRSQYNSLMEEADSLQHSYVEATHGRKRMRTSLIHCPYCEKCAIKQKAEAIKIAPHEWPLPRNEHWAKAVVFELDMPVDLREWRDISYAILVDIFSDASQSQPQKVPSSLLDYDELGENGKSSKSRYQLRWHTSSLKTTSADRIGVAFATMDQLLIDNTAQYQPFDMLRSRPIESMLTSFDLRSRCTFVLPPGPYTRLQYAVDGTSHTSNEVLASQDQCHEKLSLHEHYHFGMLRAGHRLQIHNIGREVVSRVLDFNRTETLFLLQQALWQIGPPGEDPIGRDSQTALKESHFSEELVSSLEKLLQDHEENWQNYVAIQASTIILLRIHTMTPHENVRERCGMLLRWVRSITLNWCRSLKGDLERCPEEERRKELRNCILSSSLACHTTFMVDQPYIGGVLDSEQDLATLIECTTTVDNLSPAVKASLSPLALNQSRRFWRVSHRLEGEVRARLIRDSTSLDQVVRRLWQGYTPGKPWEPVGGQHSEWLTTESAASGDHDPVTLHYNILIGTVLFNGRQLARLPKVMESSGEYRRLLGEVCDTHLLTTEVLIWT